MVLLNMLSNMPELDLTVAHYEHGIRADSDLDRQLVERAAAQCRLPFIYEHGHLGAHASEAAARTARYAFLRRVRDQVGAQAIITAHHQDDLLETAIINLLRGTGRKGLSALQSTDEIIRPLLGTTKAQLYEYAGRHPEIIWHEDNTNQDDRYLRNYVRHNILKGLGPANHALLLDYIWRAADSNPIIDAMLLHSISEHSADGAVDRRWFTMLPHDVSGEVMAAWLRASGIREFDRKLINRLVIGAKVAQAAKHFDINAAYLLKVGKADLQLLQRSPS